MKTSDNGLQFIAREEGEVLHVYNDVAGKATVGIGHLLTSNDVASKRFVSGITHQQAMDLLRVDVGTSEEWVNKLVKVPLSQNQYDSIVSFTFNMGGGALGGSTLLKLLNSGNYAGAADEFLKWCKAVINGVLTTNQGLFARRARERALFNKPDASVVVPAVPAVPVPVVPVPTPIAVVEQPIVTPVVVVEKPAAPIQADVVPAWKAIFNLIMMIVNAIFGRKN